MKIFIFIFLLFFSSFVNANSYPAVAANYYNNKTGDFFTTALAACQETVSGATLQNCSAGSTCYCYYASGVESSTLAMWRSTPDYTCPSGGTASGSTCINAPGSSQSCPAGQYNSTPNANTATCSPVPSSTSSNSYFDVNAGAFVTPSGTTPTCSPSTQALGNTSYCPPINDCQPVGSVCSNNPADIAAATAAAFAAFTPSSNLANSALNSAKSAALNASASAASLQAAATSALNLKAAADVAVNTAEVNFGGLSVQALDAQQTDTTDASASMAAAAAASNAQQSSTVAQQQVTNAQNALGQITSTQGANQDNGYAQDAVQSASNAQAAATAALNGLPPSGIAAAPGTGSAVSTAQNPITCLDCPELSTIAGKFDVLTSGTGVPLTATAQGFFDPAVPAAAVAAAKENFETQFSTMSTNLMNSVSLSAGGGAGSMPDIEYGNIRGVQVGANFSQYNVAFSWLGAVVMFMAAVISVRIFLD